MASRFEIEHLAGEGGMGAIYRARDLHDGAQVALKLLRENRRSSVDEQRLAREARLLTELRHPGIVRYVAHGSTPDGTPFLAMEWLEGEDLSAKLARTGPLSLLEAVTLARHVADALGAAHARDILHRDIKPQNLFLPDGELTQVKLVDFGIARSSSRTQSLTRSQAFIGTPSYAAPEQVRDTREVDARADVFSLGCVLFECLTGRPPFQGEHVMAILSKVLFEEAPHVSELREDLPEALGDLLARMLVKDPALRPADGYSVTAELALLSRDRPITGEFSRLSTDPIHGTQEGRFFHGYYGNSCYLPLYIFAGDFLLCARLRTADLDAAAGSLEEVQRIVSRIRARWPTTRILLRADSGFARDELMTWSAPVATWRIASRSSSWISLLTGPVPTPCSPTNCASGLLPWPTSC